MGRDSSKASGNVWYEARIKASQFNDALRSQEGAAAQVGLGRDAIVRIENDLNKVMPVDTAVMLADLYHAPELKNYYCLHECPIGRSRPLSDDPIEIDRAAVKLTKILRKETVQWVKHALQDIAADGEISDDELDEFDSVMDELKEVYITIHNRDCSRYDGQIDEQTMNLLLFGNLFLYLAFEIGVFCETFNLYKPSLPLTILPALISSIRCLAILMFQPQSQHISPSQPPFSGFLFKIHIPSTAARTLSIPKITSVSYPVLQRTEMFPLPLTSFTIPLKPSANPTTFTA